MEFWVLKSRALPGAMSCWLSSLAVIFFWIACCDDGCVEDEVTGGVVAGGFAAGNEVRGVVDVGAGVGAEADFGDLGGIAVFQGQDKFATVLGIAGVADGVGAEFETDVVDGVLLHDFGL